MASKEYYQEHKELIKAKARAYYRNDRDGIKTNIRDYRRKHKDEINSKQKIYTRSRRLKVLEYYGGTPPTCACCGESHIEFLSIDHINGGGHQHRLSLGSSGRAIYNYLIKENFPLGYRVLCTNCNASLGRYGYCPHQKEIKNGDS